MKSREEIHKSIDELIQQLNIHNNRLSLHEERISQLDVDVLRKQCIDLYEYVNRLALAGKLLAKAGKVSQSEQVVEERKQESDPEPTTEQKEETIEAPVAETSKADAELKPEKQKQGGKKKVDEEMISLFERYNSKPIDNISKAISISKRFEFQNNFFEGDAQTYKSFIVSLDEAGDREAAFEIYHEHKKRLNWENEELKDELKSLLYRKYGT
jgi:hypothetical protein